MRMSCARGTKKERLNTESRKCRTGSVAERRQGKIVT